MKRIILILIVIFCFGCEKAPVCEMVDVPYEDVIGYDNGSLQFEVTGSSKYVNDNETHYWAGAQVGVKNTDTVPGNITVEITFHENDGSVTLASSKSLEPEGEYLFKQESPTNFTHADDINIGVKIIPENVTRPVVETKYRKVERCV